MNTAITIIVSLNGRTYKVYLGHDYVVQAVKHSSPGCGTVWRKVTNRETRSRAVAAAKEAAQ